MTITEDIRTSVKSDNAIIGYREAIKFLKSNGKLKEIIIANNIIDSISKDVENNAKVINAKIRIFEGTSKDLGTSCGKPFPVSIMIIKG